MADYEESTEGAAKTAEPLAFARELAAALAEYSASANARGAAQPVPPAEAARRKKADEALKALLAQYEEQGIIPQYRIFGAALSGFFIDDVLIQPPEIIQFHGIPNPDIMEPMNASAEAAIALYIESRGGRTPDLGDQAYDAYANRPRHASIVGQRREPPPLGTPRSTSRAHIVDPAQRGEEPQENGIQVRYGTRPRDPQTGRLIPLDKSMPA